MITAFLLSLTIMTASAQTEGCESIRAAFDLGRVTFKMKVALVDTCRSEIKKILADQSVRVRMMDHYDASTKEFLSSGVDAAKEGLKQLMQTAHQHHAVEFLGVGTQLFREAKNAKVILNALTEVEPHFRPRVLSYSEEARLAYLSARTRTSIPEEQLVVWDMDSTGMQLSKRVGEEWRIAFSDIGSKEGLHRMNALKGAQDLDASIAPISKKKIDSVIESMVDQLRSEPGIEAFLADNQSNRISVVGIGFIHARSVLSVVKNDKGHYTQNDLRDAIDRLSGTPVEAIALETSQNMRSREDVVSNLLLVMAYMKALCISRISVLDVNLSDGLLVREY